MAYVAYQYRLKQLQKEYDFQSKLQQLEMTALKAQMNPHFIFNCLNSIKGLVLIGDSEKAVNYIGTFSKLVRSSLDSAEEKLLTLKEELDIAENYLSLEQLRYGPKLTWSIRCQDESLMTAIKLPPFILQPLLENAIVHGIKYVAHDGFIHIVAFREKSNVHIKIIDNGIGLQLAKAREQNNEHTTRKHLGVSLVKRRLKIIDASLSIYDHADQAGHTSGTISEIIIPQHHE
ncbi:MAG: histidine kinase [Saprospiraceae bacterium]|nr:histidine kinase [Candidatus Opimibacter iunctus]